MTEAQALALVELLDEALPSGKTMTPVRLSLYATYLMPLPYETALKTVMTFIQTSTFFPTIAELVQGVTDQLMTVPSTASAWAELEMQVARAGRNGTPHYSHELIRDVVRMKGGWETLCQFFDPSQTRFWFRETYEALVKSKREEIQKPWMAQIQQSLQTSLLLDNPTNLLAFPAPTNQ